MASNQNEKADQEDLEEKLREKLKENDQLEKTIKQLAFELHVVRKTFEMVKYDENGENKDSNDNSKN